MKYMLLMQFSEQQQSEVPPITSWTQDEILAHIAFMQDTNKSLVDAGEFVDAQGLAGRENAKIVRSRTGAAPLVTEGPFPETKEFLAGYWVIDCETPERAVEIAAHISTAPGPGGTPLNMPIELHEVMSAPSEEV